MFSGRNITGEGFGFRQQLRSGDSAGESSFNGSLSAQNSKITVGDKSTVTMTGALSLINTDLIINKGATVTAQGKMYVDKAIELAGTLTLTGTPTENNKYSPAIYMSDGYNMTEDGATLKAQNYAWVNGNIKSDKKHLFCLVLTSIKKITWTKPHTHRWLQVCWVALILLIPEVLMLLLPQPACITPYGE